MRGGMSLLRVLVRQSATKEGASRPFEREAAVIPCVSDLVVVHFVNFDQRDPGGAAIRSAHDCRIGAGFEADE